MKLQNIFLLIVLTFSNILWADEYNESNKKGFKITPSFPASDKLLLKSGETTVLKGTLCAVKARKFQKTAKCYEIDPDQVEVKAYFPDATNEVSSSLQIIKGEKEWNYSLTTPKLSGDEANTFTLVVGKVRPESSKLLEIQAKLVKRIQYIEQKIESFEAKKNTKTIAYLKHYLTNLKSVQSKINNVLEEDPGILARFVYPLQVDNNSSGPLYYSSIFGGYKFSIESPLSPVIEGESTKATARIVNLSSDNLWFPNFKEHDEDDRKKESDHKHRYFVIGLSYQGKEIQRLEPFELSFGESKSFEIDANNLHPFSDNSLELSLRRVKENNHNRKLFTELWGEIGTIIPVAEDKVPPRWGSILPEEDLKYVVKFPPISGIISDSFGRINKESLKLKITATFEDGTKQVFDRSDKLAISSLDNGARYKVDALLTEFSEGSYDIELYGTDKAGNAALPNPLIRSFAFDKTPPELAFLNPDNVFTSNNKYVFKTSVLDHSETTTKIFQNGVLIATTADKNITLDVTLNKGTNSFRLESVDAAGNVATPIELKSIVLDFTPPTIALNNLDNQIQGKANYTLNVTVADQSGTTNKIIQNGVVVYTTTQKIFNFVATLKEGLNSFEVQSVDDAGNIAIPAQLNSITLDTIAPVLALNQQSSNLITNNANFVVSGSITDSSEIEYSIFLNGLLIRNSSEKNFSYTVTLKEGKNTIEVRAKDQVGNEAISAVINNITLDTIPPTLSILAPANSSVLKGIDLLAKAISNEQLQNAQINGENTTLSSDKLQFERIFSIEQDGSTNIVFRATDLAGNSSEAIRNVTIDNTSPEIIILSRHGFDTTETNYLLKLNINELHNVQTQVFFNGVLLSEGTFKTFEQSLTLKEGTNSFLIKVVDQAGNSSEYKSRDIVVDSIAPIISSTTQQNILTNNKSFNINATFEDISTVRFELFHDGLLLLFDYEKNLNQLVTLNEGLNNFILKAHDLAGNQAQDLLISNITLDTIKPQISSPNTDGFLTNKKTFNIHATITEVHIGESVILQNDVEVFKTTGSNISYAAKLNEGKNEFIIKSIDLAKNESDTLTLRNITLNSSKPVIASTNKGNIVQTESLFVLNARITDDLETTTVIKHNNKEILQTGDKNISLNIILTSGSNNFEIISTDAAGNISETFTLSGINLDDIAPLISSNIQSDKLTNQKNFTLQAIIEDVSNVDVKVFHNGNLVYTGDSKILGFPVTLLEGQNSFEIKVSDLAGNQAEPFIIKNIVLDTVKPVITSNSAHDFRTKDPLYFVSASAYDTSSLTFKLLLNGQEIYSAPSSYLQHLITLAEGTNRLEFIAIDAAGNLSESFNVENIVLDTLPPVLNLATAGEEAQSETIHTLSGTITDQSTYIYQIYQNGTLITEGTQSPFNITTNLATGKNTFKIVATDELKNTSNKDINIYLDTAAPIIEIASFPTLTKNKFFSLNVKIQDESDTTTQIFQNQTLIETSSLKEIVKNTTLLEGPNQFSLRSSDSKGNQLDPEKSFIITLDSSAPSISFSPSNGYRFNLTNNPNQNLVIRIQDSSTIDFKRLRVKLNGDLLNSDLYSINQQSKEVSILMSNPDLPVLLEKENIFSMEIADELQNIAIASSKYRVINDEENDGKPIINFNPAGGVVVAPLASIDVGFSSKIGIDYSSLVITIDGNTVPSNQLTLDQNHSKISINLSNVNQTPDKFGLLIQVTVSDLQHKSSYAAAGINFFNENTTLMAEIVTDDAYGSSGTYNGHMCVPLLSGKAKCWGNNEYGQLGILVPPYQVGNERNLAQSSNVDLGEKIIKIRSAGLQTCAIVESGKVYCWGENTSGELGYGNTLEVGKTILPKNMGPLEIGEKVKDITVSLRSICVLLESARVKCWGTGYGGASGYGQTFTWTKDKKPINIPYLNVGGLVNNITSGLAHICALLENGEVRCWGGNYRGQLGYGHINLIGDNEVPSDVGSVPLGEKAVQISLGYEHSCALLESGGLKCWGFNDMAQLGYNNTSNVGDYKPIDNLDSINFELPPVQVSLGYKHSCALFPNHKIKCWGLNYYGQLGLGKNDWTIKNTSTLPYIDVGEDVKSVHVVDNRTCVTLMSNQLKCWGDNRSSLLGQAQVIYLGDDESITAEAPIVPGAPAIYLTAGHHSTCAVDASGKARCWGENKNQKLSPSSDLYIGDKEPVTTLEPINTNFNISQMSDGGYEHICALTTTQNVRCWGYSTYGALGAGTTSYVAISDAQDLLGPGEKAIQVETSDNYSCALLVGGNVRCWGQNGNGKLGLGHKQNINYASSTSTNISIGEQVIQITTGWNHVCALTSTGKVKCWGSNNTNELGLGYLYTAVGDNELPSSVPFVNLGAKAKYISAGSGNTCAILENGNFRCWGKNQRGETGYPPEDMTYFGSPSSKPELNLGYAAREIISRNTYTCGLMSNGKMKCWGGSKGLLKDQLPLPIPESITKISASDEHTCALLNNASIRCWGSNEYAALGYPIVKNMGIDEVPSSISPISLGDGVLFLGSDNNVNLIAHYEPNIYYGQGPLEVTFNAITSSSVAGQITSYQWDFGDNSPIQLTQSPITSYVYNSQGVFTAKLTITDEAGNSASYSQYITVLGENILPTAKLAANITTGTTPLNVTFSGSESFDPAGSIINYQFIFGDGQKVSTSNSTVSHIFYNPGHYSAKVIVTDNNGGKTTSEAILITIPAHPSAPIISSSATGHIRTGNELYNINATVLDDEDVTLKVLHNGQIIFTGQTKSFNDDLTLAQGTNYFEIQAVDENGHAAIPLVVGYIVLDTNVPVVASTIKSNTYTNQVPFSLNVQVTDDTRTTTKVFLNDNLVTTSLSETFLVDLSLTEGSNKVEVISTDEFGMTSSPLIISNLILDTKAPILANITPAANSFISKNSVEVSATSNEVLKEASVNGLALNLSSDKTIFTGTLVPSNEGDFNITISAKDLAGNEKRESFKVTVDTHPPLLTHSNTSGYLSSDSTYTINATVNDISGTTTEIYQNGKKVYTTTDSQITYNATLNEGSNTFVIKSFDTFGNEVNPAYIGDINLDKTAPQIVSYMRSDLFTNNSSFPIELSILEPQGATTKVFKNGIEILTTTMKNISATTPLQPGNNNFEIRSVDGSGNVSVPVSIKNIYLDQVAPVLTLHNLPQEYEKVIITQDANTTSSYNKPINTLVAQSTLNIQGDVSDETGVNTKFVLNGRLYKTISNKNFSEAIVLTEGVNTIEMIPEDEAGNIGTAIRRGINLDTQAPILTSTLSGTKNVFDSTFVIDLKVQDLDQTTTEVFVNGNGVYLTSNKEFNLPVQLKPGENIITATCKDTQGHVSAPFEVIRLTYDDTAPIINLATNGDVYTNIPQFTLVAEIIDISDIKSTIRVNDQLAHIVADKNISVPLTLVEGRNRISIETSEVESNRKSIKLIDNIVLDTVLPIINTSNHQNITTNDSLFKLSIAIQDSIGTKAEIYLNNRLTYKSGEKSFVAPILLSPGRNDIRIEAKDLAGNMAMPVELQNILYETRSNIATTIGVGGGKNSVTNSSSSIYGAMVDIGPGAVNEDVELAVNVAQVSDLPSIPGVPTPDPIGPILNISVSKTVSGDKTFNNEVVVGIPFSPMLALDKNINTANISIVRYDSLRGVVENIRPFKIDYAKGIAYGYTNSFSHFFVSSGREYPKMAVEIPQNCRKLDLGYSCDLADQDFNLSGIFRLKGLMAETDLHIICDGCSTSVTGSKSFINEANEGFIAFTLAGGSSSTTDSLRLTFKVGNLIAKEKITINYAANPQIPAESILLSNCYEPGAVCKELGTGAIAFSNDGSQAVDSALNISLGNIFRPNRFKLKNFITKHDGILYWIEPKNHLPTYRIQDLISYRLNEFTLRRKNLDGTISTVDTFAIAMDSAKMLFNEWEYNFNLQVVDQLALFTLDSNNHLFDVSTDTITLSNGAKLISIDKTALTKRYLEESAGFVLNEIKEVKATNSSIFLTGTSFNNLSDAQYKEGLFKYDLLSNSWDYLTKGLTNSESSGTRRDPGFSVDSNNISEFDGRNLTNINLHNGDIYFIDAGHNCLRRFDGNSTISTIVGMCNAESVYKGLRIDYAKANPTQMLLGDLKSAEIDNNGNIYLSQNIQGNMELSLIAADSNLMKGAIKETSTNRLPASTQALRMDSIKVALDEYEDSKIRIDNGNNLYFYNNSCVYNVVDPYEYLFHQLPFEESNFDLVLNDSTLSNIILDTQKRDGLFSFDHSTDNVSKNLSDTLDALKFLAKNGSSNPDALNKAQYWVSNQNFNDTKNAANQLEALAILAKQNGSVTLTPEIKTSLSKFLKGFRPNFGGWGSTANHIINNEDTAAAIRAISFIFNQIPTGSVDSPIYLSEFIVPLRELINEQFSSTSGIFGGGFGPTNNQNMPTLHITLEVVDGLLEYKKLNSTDNKIIAWNRKSDFQVLAFTEIPAAVLRSLTFLRTYRKVDGSFGDLKTTVKVLNTFSDIVKGGITTDPTVLESLKTDIMKGIAFIKNQEITKASATELASLSALDNLSDLGKTIALAPNETPATKEASRVPASVDTQLFGTGADGVLSVIGNFNINQLASGDRKHADAANAKVTNVIKKYVYVESIAEDALAKDDEVLIINLQGTEAGSYKFARVNNIFYNESPILIELDHDIVTDGFLASPNDKIMIQRVPNYSGISKSNPVTLKADPFNGEVGGVVAFRVQGEVPENVSIDVSGLGFRGGVNNGSTSLPGEGQLGFPESPYFDQSKSCGGDKSIEGFFVGGGGAYATAGSFNAVAPLPAKSGSVFGSAELTKIFLGCGGGSGLTNNTDVAALGGAGGGIVLVYASKITFNTNYIKLNGVNGTKGSDEQAITHGAGGGSGGSVVLNIKELVILKEKNVSASGGPGTKGANDNLGQNGGEGRIRINAKILNGALVTNEQKNYLKQKLSNEFPYIGVFEGK